MKDRPLPVAGATMPFYRSLFASFLKRWFRRYRKVRLPGAHLRRPLFLEPLESRVVPATLTVNSYLDTVNAAGMLSLRDAITIVNGGTSVLAAFNSQEQQQVKG